MKNTRICVRQATLKAYKSMPGKFPGIILISVTRKMLGNNKVYDGNILRRLRELRSADIINYIYKPESENKGMYKKLKLNK